MRIRVLHAVPTLLCLVLVFALGSAGAASAGGLTKGAVKRIAGKLLATRSGSLSVSHAASADTAGYAKTAVDALTATDSKKLGGLPPAAYQDHFVQAAPTTQTSVGGGGVGQPAAAVISVPVGINHVHLIGVTSVLADRVATVGLWVSVDQDCSILSGPEYQSRGSVDGAGAATQLTFQYVAAVSPGEHTLRLCLNTVGGAVSASQPVLIGETVVAGPNE